MKEPQTFTLGKSDNSTQYICIESKEIQGFSFEKDSIYSFAFLGQKIPNIRYKLKCTLLKKVFILFLESQEPENVEVAKDSEVDPTPQEPENVEVMLYIAKNINNENFPEGSYHKESELIKSFGIRKMKGLMKAGLILQTKQLA